MDNRLSTKLLMIRINNNSDLVVSAQSGRRDGLNRLTEDANERLYPYIFHLILDHNTSEDIMQEVLLAITVSINTLKNPDNFWPWAHKIVYSKIKQHLRDKARSAPIFLPAIEDYADKNKQCPSTLDIVIKNENKACISNMVGKLKTRYRVVTQLRYFQGLSYAEIASLTNTTPQKARHRLFRAKQILKNTMQPLDLACR